MSEVFQVSQANFYNSIRAVQKIIQSPQPSEQDFADAGEAIKQAAQEVNKMEIQYNINRIPQFKAKIDVFKEEYRKYKRDLSKAETAYRDHQAEQHSGPLFQKDQEAERGIDPLLQAKRQMYENQEMSNQVATNLRKNTETIVKNINRMDDINQQLTVAHKLLNSIKTKLRKNKLVMYGTLAFLMLVLMFIFYSYVGNRGSSNNNQSSSTDEAPVKVKLLR